MSSTSVTLFLLSILFTSSMEKIKEPKVNYSKIDKIIPYSNVKAIKYAKDYAGKNDNTCGKYFNDSEKKLSDCAHFVSHCLFAGGIKIENPDPTNKICPTGLAVRVSDIIKELRKLDAKYTNITEIDFDEIPIVGDYGFLDMLKYRPTHAFMVCTPAVDPNEIKLYGHTTNRVCEKSDPKWYQFFDTAFRISDK